MVFMRCHVQKSIANQRGGKESLLQSWQEAEDPISYATGVSWIYRWKMQIAQWKPWEEKGLVKGD